MTEFVLMTIAVPREELGKRVKLKIENKYPNVITVSEIIEDLHKLDNEDLIARFCQQAGAMQVAFEKLVENGTI